jgi:hypothetical protein
VTRERYVSCERKSPLEGDLKRFEVVRVRSEPSPIPGGEETAPSTAVTFRVTLKLPGLPKAQPITHTAHVFAVGDRWAWVIGPSDFAVYAAGRCPGDI